MKSRSWWEGYLLGVLDAISIRQDVPTDLRNKCIDINKAYEKFIKDEYGKEEA